ADVHADSQPPDLQIANPVFGANGDAGVVDGAVLNRDLRSSQFTVPSPQAEADLVVLKHAVFHADLDVVLQVQGRHVADLVGLVPAREQAIANDQPAPRVGGRLLGIDRVLSRPLAALESARISGERRRPQAAVFDRYVIPFAAPRIELD